MTYDEILAMPVRTFWAFNKNISRLRAEVDIRTIKNLTMSQSPEACMERQEGLIEEYGVPMEAVDNRRDTDATGKMRRLLSG